MTRYRDEIEKLLVTTFENFTVNIGELGDDTDLTLNGMDSIGAVALIVAIENKFGIEVADEDLIIDNLNSIQKINDMIAKYVTHSEGTNEPKEIVKVSYLIPFYTQRVDLDDANLQGFKSKQEAEHWQVRGCGIVCIKMIIDGIQIHRDLKFCESYGELVYKGVEMGAYCDRGWIHKGLVELAKEYYIAGQTFRHSNAHDVLIEIEKDRPCIASVSVGFNGGKINSNGEVIKAGGHLIVVVGAVRAN